MEQEEKSQFENEASSRNTRRRTRRPDTVFRKAEETVTDTILDGAIGEGTTDESGIFDKEKSGPESPFKEDVDGKKPDRHAARASGESLLATVVIGAGTLLVNRRIDPPVGRVLQLEAPIAGQQIDKLIANTFIDKLLQPLFRKSDQFEGLGAVIGLPILVAVVERKPEVADILAGPLEEMVGTILEQTAPLMSKEKAKRRRAAKTINMEEDFGIEMPRGADPSKFMLGWIFQDMIQAEGEEEVGQTA